MKKPSRATGGVAVAALSMTAAIGAVALGVFAPRELVLGDALQARIAAHDGLPLAVSGQVPLAPPIELDANGRPVPNTSSPTDPRDDRVETPGAASSHNPSVAPASPSGEGGPAGARDSQPVSGSDLMEGSGSVGGGGTGPTDSTPDLGGGTSAPDGDTAPTLDPRPPTVPPAPADGNGQGPGSDNGQGSGENSGQGPGSNNGKGPEPNNGQGSDSNNGKGNERPDAQPARPVARPTPAGSARRRADRRTRI